MTLIQFLGGCREVGRSAVLIENLVLDYGIKPKDPPEFPVSSKFPKYAIISHAHLDHVGACPILTVSDTEFYMTPITMEISHVLLKDSMKLTGYVSYTPRDLVMFETRTKFAEIDETFELDGWLITFMNSGHIPGSVSIHLSGKLNILYTSDIKLQDTRLMTRADISYPEIDVAIIESTYFGVKHPDRKKLEKAFVESIKETIENGGYAIIPAFAVARTHEVLMILNKYKIRAYVDGLGLEIAKIFERYPEYLRDLKELKKALKRAIPVKRGKREEILKEPSVIVTTAGMLNGGPALFYISRLYEDEKSKILLTGYQIEGTNGDLALKQKMIRLGSKTVKLKMAVEQYDFSAHADDEQLKKVAKKCADRGAEIIFTVHGENTEDFAKWIKEEIGVESYAPRNGETFVI